MFKSFLGLLKLVTSFLCICVKKFFKLFYFILLREAEKAPSEQIADMGTAMSTPDVSTHGNDNTFSGEQWGGDSGG